MLSFSFDPWKKKRSTHKCNTSDLTHTHTHTQKQPWLTHHNLPRPVSPPGSGGGSSRLRRWRLSFPTSRGPGNHSYTGWPGWVPVSRMECRHVELNSKSNAQITTSVCLYTHEGVAVRSCPGFFTTSGECGLYARPVRDEFKGLFTNCSGFWFFFFFVRLPAASWRVWKHTWTVWRTLRAERRGKKLFESCLVLLTLSMKTD